MERRKTDIIKMGNSKWFHLGTQCAVLLQNLVSSIEKAHGEVKLGLSQELQKLNNLVESVLSGDIEEDNIAKAENVYNSICINYCIQSGEGQLTVTGRYEEVQPFENSMDALKAYYRARSNNLEWWLTEGVEEMKKYKMINDSDIDMVAFNEELKTFILSRKNEKEEIHSVGLV